MSLTTNTTHSSPWRQRKARLSALLKSQGDEDADGLALDRLMHGHQVIGKTSRTREIEELRFQDKDLELLGTLEYGQFGVIDVVTCRLNSAQYVRKSIQKVFAMRVREQCSPQYERDLLMLARKSNTKWAPHLLCAFQTSTHLNFIMDYAEGGNLWDVLESSPEERIRDEDMRWWAPQMVSAIHWCHTQGFVHRDIKPHNFVLTPTAHLLLIDFGSAAPLLPKGPDGAQRIPKRYCLVPCGTCDYISPEILTSHEEALVALEFEDDESFNKTREVEGPGYGMETDWWSLGVLLYEMAYGVAPFFSSDIRQTYLRIVDHERCLQFDQDIDVPEEYEGLIRGLLTHAELRLGRKNIMEIIDHPYFDGVSWGTLHDQQAPTELHLPQFEYQQPQQAGAYTGDNDLSAANGSNGDQEYSKGFQFSALFQSSAIQASGVELYQSPLADHNTSNPAPNPALSSLISSVTSSRLGAALHESSSSGAFIGFSWGPPLDAFSLDPFGADEETEEYTAPIANGGRPGKYPLASLSAAYTSNQDYDPLKTPKPRGRQPSVLVTPKPLLPAAPTPFVVRTTNPPRTPGPGGVVEIDFPIMTAIQETPRGFSRDSFATPARPGTLSTPYPSHYYNAPHYQASFMNTVPKPNNARRTVPRRTVSDREAFKQLIDCVTMSARKKVLESGKKPKVLINIGTDGKRTRKTSQSRLGSLSGFGVEKLEWDHLIPTAQQQQQKPPLSIIRSGASTSVSNPLASSSVLQPGPSSGLSTMPPSALRSSKSRTSATPAGAVRKELRFLPSPIVQDSDTASSNLSDALLFSASNSFAAGMSVNSGITNSILSQGSLSLSLSIPSIHANSNSLSQSYSPHFRDAIGDPDGNGFGAASETETDDSDAPPSPSPSPRPGSAMSMLSRRSGSGTPITTGSSSRRHVRSGSGSSGWTMSGYATVAEVNAHLTENLYASSNGNSTVDLGGDVTDTIMSNFMATHHPTSRLAAPPMQFNAFYRVEDDEAGESSVTDNQSQSDARRLASNTMPSRNGRGTTASAPAHTKQAVQAQKPTAAPTATNQQAPAPSQSRPPQRPATFVPDSRIMYHQSPTPALSANNDGRIRADSGNRRNRGHDEDDVGSPQLRMRMPPPPSPSPSPPPVSSLFSRQNTRDSRDPWESRESRESRELWEARVSGESREPRDTHNTRDTRGSSLDMTLEDLDRRHAKLMLEIRRLEERLNRVVS